MAGRIVVLPDDLTNKIAAGEVVERPASVVKELLENSLDAGATDIVVELRRGGCESIRITDNGMGIEAPDAALAFARFATSKIYQFDDIYRVHSFGFRGEALPSIASIARVEMVTKKRGEISGVRVIAERGEIQEITEAGCPEGTSMFVANIFDPVPVRRKFLKSEATEQGHCLDVIVRLALAHPALSLKVVANGREVLSVPAVKKPGERLALLLGADFLDEMVSFSGSESGMRLEGFASRPSLSRANAKNIYPYVNKRFIRDPLINHAIMTAYRHLIEAKRYPAALLFLDLPPGEVDVNVHPAKMEVRFREPRKIYELVVSTLAGALSGVPVEMPPATQEGGRPLSPSRSPAIPQYHARVEEALKRYTLSGPAGRETSPRDFGLSRGIREAAPGLPFEEIINQGESLRISFSNLNYIGQVLNSYLIFSSRDGMIIVDQHAAHERIYFEQFKKAALASNNPVPSQRLLMPQIISLSPRDNSFLTDCLPLLQNCGFEIEPFGNDTVVLKSVPVIFANGEEPQQIILDFLAEFVDCDAASLEGRKERLYSFLACKRAVKSNQRLLPQEVAALCKDLDTIPNIATCPHGRPVFTVQTLGDLEKMFKRR